MYVSGTRLSVPKSSSLQLGQRVQLLVRPEDMSLTDNGFPGTVTAVTFQGSTTLVGVRVDVLDQLVTVDVGRGAADRLSIGDRVSVGVDGTHGVCEPV